MTKVKGADKSQVPAEMELNTADRIFTVRFLQAHHYFLVLTHLRTLIWIYLCLQMRQIQSVPCLTTIGGADKSQVPGEADINISDRIIAVSFLQTHHYLLVLTHLRTLIWTYTCLQTRKIRSVPATLLLIYTYISQERDGPSNSTENQNLTRRIARQFMTSSESRALEYFNYSTAEAFQVLTGVLYSSNLDIHQPQNHSSQVALIMKSM